MSNPAKKIDELVLVVHGVGDPRPGETLSLFARSIAEKQSPLSENQETLWLDESDEKHRDVKTFPSHVRHLNINDNSVTLAEVFWGDLSRVGRGTFGALLGLIQVVFGLRYVTYVAGDQEENAVRRLQKLGLIIFRILQGPILAVNVVLAGLVFAIVASELLWSGSSMRAGWSNILALIHASTGMIVAASASKATKNRMFERFWFWLFIASGFLAMLVVIRVISLLFIVEPDHSAHLAAISSGLGWYCRVYAVLMGTLCLMLMGVTVAMFVTYPFALSAKLAHQPAVHVAMSVPAIAVGVWGQLLPLCWLAGGNAIERLVELPEFHQVFQEALPLLGVQCLMCILLAIILGGSLGRYLYWRIKYNIQSHASSKGAPRLIVDAAFQYTVIFCAALGVVLVIYLAGMELAGLSYQRHYLGRFLAEANKYAIGMLVPIAGVSLFCLRYLQPVLDMALDVVNHFYFRRTQAQEEETRDEFDCKEVFGEPGETVFTKRKAIHDRMKRILDYFSKNSLGLPELTIVSHSQGTMIAIEVLNDPEMRWLMRSYKRINLVTMGSPFCHIYQHYFGHAYPDLGDSHWEPMRLVVDQWINIYRIDDFVGTKIDFNNSSKENWINYAVEKKGHNYYWTDRDVLAIIRQHDICHWASSKPDIRSIFLGRDQTKVDHPPIRRAA